MRHEQRDLIQKRIQEVRYTKMQANIQLDLYFSNKKN